MSINYEQPFDIMALDSDYNLVTIVMYNALQWNRKCREAGIFSIELTVQQYDNSWCYIYSPQRRELGRISQVNLIIEKGKSTVTISGKFIEDDLNRMIVYPKPAYEYDASKPYTSIVNGPEWLTQSGTADQVALAFFNGFKSITYKGYVLEDVTGQNLLEKTYTLDISYGIIDNENGSYDVVSHNRDKESLGKKIYQILESSNAFFEVNYDRETNAKTFVIKHGRDLTNSTTDHNPVIFSTQNNTLTRVGIVSSDTETKDVGLMIQDNGSDNVIVLVDGYTDAIGRFTVVSDNPSTSDYPVDHDFRVATLNSIANELMNTKDKLNLSFDAFDGSYEYMVDFDVGDVVSVTAPEIDLDVDVQIIGCYETVQNGVWGLSLEFGTPLKNRR